MDHPEIKTEGGVIVGLVTAAQEQPKKPAKKASKEGGAANDGRRETDHAGDAAG